MLLRKLRLVNYGGIYNGMHLYEINIDFTKCKNRIILIRGDNGSGKTTIEQSLKPLPDSNDSFIVGKTAIKEIDYYDEVANIIYAIQFIHECKPNGDRNNAKGYIKKIIVSTNEIHELNPSGNITRCKEIIYEEFQLDPNYIALTQLSSTERGLADKRPADRKKYVNAIVNNTEVYNDIHKKLSKKSSTYKGLMGSIVSKLDSIGDKGKLDAELISLNNKIKELSDINNNSIQNRAAAEGGIRELDPDGSFVDKINDLYNNKNSILKSIEEIDNEGLRFYINRYDINKVDDTTINNLNKLIDNFENNKSSKQKNIEELLQSRELDATELQTKTSKLQSINSGINYEQCKSIQSQCIEIINSIEERFKFVDLKNISQEEFVSAIETITSIKNEINEFIQTIPNGLFLDVVENKCSSVITMISETEEKIKDLNNIIINHEIQIRTVTEKSKIVEALNIRPEKCKINDCPYIKQAYEAKLELDNINLNNIISEMNSNKSILKELQEQLEYYNEYNRTRIFVDNCIKKLGLFKRSLSKFNQLEGLIEDINEFMKKMCICDNHVLVIIDELSYYLDIANDIEQYKAVTKEYERVTSELKSLESQADFIELLEKDIKTIQNKLDSDMIEIEHIQNEIKEIDISIINYNRKLEDVKNIVSLKNKKSSFTDNLSQIEKEIESEKIKIDKINNYRNMIDKSNNIIHETDIQLKPLLERREMINYQLNLMTQYIQELEEYKSMYNKIETLKYYSSPTTGIQLLFVSIYMNKILDNANRLLCNLFNGQFALLPFIITESEFRIPVAVDGGLNHEDITTMSSAQIALLSMIISISLLSQTSTKLNIIVGDEIDAPFDGTNRRQFFEILDRLRMLVNANQCVLISHNSELSQYDCDVILLKNENSDDRSNSSGNIIWSYYNQ